MSIVATLQSPSLAKFALSPSTHCVAPLAHMLGLILGVHAGAPQPMALEPQQEEEGCASLSPNVPAAWCDTTCGPAPRSDQCKGICKCPVAELSKVPAPPAPEPRIIGGWTNCGPDSGVEEWYATHGSDPCLAGRRLICHTLTCTPRFGQAGEVGAES